jgi:uncharacterized protein YlxP (DUF503 family)
VARVLILAWELTFPGCRSLKEKRATLRSLKDRLRHRFHVSVAETAYQDVLDRAELTVAFVASDGSHAEEMAGKIERLVQESPAAFVAMVRRERI